jgi:hypothetical protein
MAYKIKIEKPKAKAIVKAREFRNIYIELDEEANEVYGSAFSDLDEKEQKKVALKVAKEGYGF